MQSPAVTREAVKIIKVLMKSGQHRGKCKFNMPNGACSKHVAAYERRIKRAQRFLAAIK